VPPEAFAAFALDADQQAAAQCRSQSVQQLFVDVHGPSSRGNGTIACTYGFSHETGCRDNAYIRARFARGAIRTRIGDRIRARPGPTPRCVNRRVSRPRPSPYATVRR
jgi:hypothetical protein